MTDPEFTPERVASARAHFDSYLRRNVDALFERPDLAELLAAFVDGRAGFVLTRETFTLLPVAELAPEALATRLPGQPADDTNHDGPGFYL